MAHALQCTLKTITPKPKILNPELTIQGPYLTPQSVAWMGVDVGLLTAQSPSCGKGSCFPQTLNPKP